MAFSVSIMRLVKYVAKGLSILYCRPLFGSSICPLVNLIFFRFLFWGKIVAVPDCCVKVCFLVAVWLVDGPNFC